MESLKKELDDLKSKFETNEQQGLELKVSISFITFPIPSLSYLFFRITNEL